jgi:DNA-binding response OmpR family regulator
MIASNDAAALPALTNPLSRIDRAESRNLGSRPKLLLVDDEPTVGRMLFHAAEECGYRAIFASNAAAFRCQYEAENPAVLLLDLSLPGGDGIELLRFLAERNCRSPILIVSGHDRRVVESAKRLGVALGLRMGGCLTKPVRVHELAQALERSHQDSREEGGGDDRHICFGS